MEAQTPAVVQTVSVMVTISIALADLVALAKEVLEKVAEATPTAPQEAVLPKMVRARVWAVRAMVVVRAVNVQLVRHIVSLVFVVPAEMNFHVQQM